MVKTVVSPLSAETLILARVIITDFDTLEAYWTNNLIANPRFRDMVTLGLTMKSGANFGTASFGRVILGEVRISDWKGIAM